MHTDGFHPAPAHPEWRRSSVYLLLAAALHGLLLLYPLHLARQQDPPLPVLQVDMRSLDRAPSSPTASPPHPAAPASTPARPRPVRSPPARPVITASESPAPPTAAPASPAPAPPAQATRENSGSPTPAAGHPGGAGSGVTTAARFDAAYLNNPQPPYPALSRRLGEEGKVLLRVRVGADGLPLAVDLEKSSDFPRLDDAARRVVSRWRFIPARVGDRPVEASVIVPIVFRLEG